MTDKEKGATPFETAPTSKTIRVDFTRITPLYEHPDGDGAIEYAGGILIVRNDCDATLTRVLIGPAGLRDLASRLCSIADRTEGGGR